MPATATDFDRAAEEALAQGLSDENTLKLASALAHSFAVRADEVGILRVNGARLEFLYPLKLRNLATIPLNASGSVAAQTVNAAKPQIINNFSQVRHTTLFEAVNLREESSGNRQTQVIQKLMSVPIPGGKTPLGVIQVSRKGASPAQAGMDFNFSDLQKLMSKAAVFTKLLK